MIRIFAARTDSAIDQYDQAIQTLGLSGKIEYYEGFSFTEKHLLYEGEAFAPFSPDDTVLFRPAYNQTPLHFLVRTLAVLADISGAQIINKQQMLSFPTYSDKLFQATFFATCGLDHVPTYWQKNVDVGTLPKPVILKRRLGAFGRGSCLVQTEADWQDVSPEFATLGEEYIVQPFRKLARDVRVVVLGGEIIGAVLRRVIFHADRRVSVKVTETTELTAEERLLAEKSIQALTIELGGLDILTAEEDGRAWLGEVNFAPNFAGYDSVTKAKVPEEVLRYLETRQPKK